jgi:hypothetical protein
LESLKTSGLDFIFKGGTSLLLLLGTPNRFSIDIDIVLKDGQNLEGHYQAILKQGVFHRFEENRRESNLPKQHYKFYFNSVIQGKESSILLDILYENNPYPRLQEVAVSTPLLVTEGELTRITCPTKECLLGDKLTAFAPNTTGIPYGKKKELEIIKQLFDVGLLFDVAENVALVGAAFEGIASKELAYRDLTHLSPRDVLQDIFNTACIIGMRGFNSHTEYAELLSGIKKLPAFVYSGYFSLDAAILCAAKAAYLSTLIQKGKGKISRFNENTDLSSLAITNPNYNKLNKVKKTIPEAFYYFYRALEELGRAVI